MKKNSFLLKTAVAVVGSLSFIIIFNFLPDWVTAAMSTLVAVLIYIELGFNAKLVTFMPMKVIGTIVSAAIPWLIYFETDTYWLFILIFISAIAAFISLVIAGENGRAHEIIGMISAESIFQISISLMTPILRTNHGVAVIIMAFITAWGTDAFAQLGGKAFGKTKFLPKISPNKTLEGSLCGVTGNAAVIIIFALILNYRSPEVSAIGLIICGIICGFIGEIGDLFFSYVKRSVGIKDFGKFIAGHGGVLDRFDSVVFVLPLWYAFVKLIQM